MSSVVIPSFRYKDAHAAIDWLERALGFTRKAVYDGPDGTVGHAELVFGNSMIMLGSQSNPSPMKAMLATPAETGGRVTSPMYLLVADCEPVYAKAKAVGTEFVQELRTMDYGGRAFTVRDPEGYMWSFGEYDPWK
jgi:uncharacterized glyoxalase superfamily protein PhnB